MKAKRGEELCGLSYADVVKDKAAVERVENVCRR